MLQTFGLNSREGISSRSYFNDKINGFEFRIKSSHAKPSSHITLSPENIIRPIRKSDHQWHSSASDWGWVCRMMWSYWRPSCQVSDRTLMSLHLPAVAAANLLLPDVIKGSWSSEWWRGSFLGRSLPLSGHKETHSGFNTVQTQPEWGNAWCRDSGGLHQETFSMD